MTRFATDDSYLSSYTQRHAAHTAHATEALTFYLGDELYGIELSWMREIAKLGHVTELPRVPACLLGVASLRGLLLPVVDLRIRMNRPATTLGSTARLLVVDVAGELVGFVVDRVLRVMRIESKNVEHSPFAGSGESDYVASVVRMEGLLFALLDVAGLARVELGGA